MKLNVNIVEVNNGYIVTHYPDGRACYSGEAFVATTKKGLAQLVQDLADDCDKEIPTDGPLQKP